MNIAVHCTRARDNIDTSEVNCNVLNRKSLNNFEEYTRGSLKSIINHKYLLCLFITYVIHIYAYFLTNILSTDIAVLVISLHPRFVNEGRNFDVCMILVHGSLSLFISFSIRLPLFYVSAIVIKSARRTGRGLLQLPSTPHCFSNRLFPMHSRSATLVSPTVSPSPLLVVRPSVSPLRVTLSSAAHFPAFPRHCPYVMKRA